MAADPTTQRALLAAMAQQGTQAVAQFNSAQVNTQPAADGSPVIATPAATVGPQGPAPQTVPPTQLNAAGSRKDAVSAALQRAQQIDAPLALQGSLTGQVGAAYDQAAATRGRNAGAFAAQAGGYNRATSDYLAQIEAARPILDARTELAVRQIMAERSDAQAERAYRRDALRLDRDKLDFERQQFEAQQIEDGLAEPRTLTAVAKRLGVSADQAQATVSTPGYDTGRQLIMQAAQDGYSSAELRGLLDSYVAAGVITGADGITQQPFTKEIANLLYETYQPAFVTKAEAAEESAARGKLRSALASGQAFDVVNQRAVPAGQRPPTVDQRYLTLEDGTRVPRTKLAEQALAYRLASRNRAGK